MKFRTEVIINKYPVQIEHQSQIITFGSCFAQNIGEYFKFYRFNILENPFGILYNSASIYNSINLLFENKKFKKSDLIYYQEQWHSFYHHSNFSETDWKKCIQNINNSLKNALKFLENSKFVILTFGTSYVYKFNKTNLIVSNCHKLPQSNFTRFRLSVEENINYITSAIKLLSQINPNINVILTVSPIRHLKDGAAENQLSKASLLLAIDEVVNNTDNCYYFPSYEIMLDELRDYRFYAQDMLHPGKSAIDYIWEKFSDAFFSDECKSIMKEVGKISKAKNHIPRNKEVKSYQTFLLNQIDLIDKLSKKYPHLNLLDDKIFFKSQLK